MFPMTPEDTYRQVKRYQDEQRAQMACERMTRAASPERSTGPSRADASGARPRRASGPR